MAENRLHELGAWDEDLLNDELNALFSEGYDFSVTGFELADLNFSVPDTPSAPEQVELPVPGSSAISRPGDLWLIGPHRLYCGDARDAASYEVLLAGMIFSDPPYNVRMKGHATGHGRVQHREFLMMSGEASPAEFTAFLRDEFRNCARFSRNGSIHYQCMDWRHMREMLDAAEGIYEHKQLIVWVKPAGGQGAFYRSRHELIFVFKSGSGRHTNNFRLGETGRYRTNVFEYAGANTFRKGRVRDLADHPTVKPTALLADAILDCSDRGDLILDPFCGSGTSVLAAHRTGRRGAAIELDPLYVDTALRRLCEASGLTAVNSEGKSFEEVAAERESGEANDA